MCSKHGARNMCQTYRVVCGTVIVRSTYDIGCSVCVRNRVLTICAKHTEGAHYMCGRVLNTCVHNVYLCIFIYTLCTHILSTL